MAQEGEEVSLRDTINEAMDQHNPEPTEEPVKETPAEETPPETTTPEKEVKDEPKIEEKPEETKGERERGERGRFKKREAKTDQPPAKEEKKEAVKEQPKEDDLKLPKSRAPGTWTPAAREHWPKLPPPVQQEILRRERDIANGFNEVGRIRQFGQGMHDLWSPFQSIIAAEGGDAMKMTRDLFITAASLYNGSPEAKVRTVAGLINTFGVDIRMLDSALAGEAPKGDTPPHQNINMVVQQAVNQALAPFARQQQNEEVRITQEINSDIDKFAQDPKNEWFMDVKDTMADLMEVASKQGKSMDLQTAYNRAIMMHSEIADVMQERSLREKAAAKSAVAVAARKKAVSVTGAPAKEPAGSSANSSLRDDIVSAIDQLET